MASPSLKLPASYTVCVSPQQRLVVALGRNVVVVDLVARKRIASWHVLSHPSHAAFSADESLLAVKSTWGEVVVVDTTTGTVLARSRPKTQDEGASIHFSPCGKFLIDGSWSGKIRVRQVSDLAVVQEFTFNGEMISSTSTSSDAKLWLFSHQPKTTLGAQRGAAPYLTLWNWPLREPKARVPTGFDNLYAAQLAPSKRHVAVVGNCEASKAEELRLITLSGEVVAVAAVLIGGTGSSTRWSRDSKFVGIVGAREFRVFAAPTLELVASISEEYPSDLAFISNSAEIVLGSWKSGRVAPIGGDA
jgi:WD40 repeat protein